MIDEKIAEIDKILKDLEQEKNFEKSKSLYLKGKELAQTTMKLIDEEKSIIQSLN